jgi:hypothetical protein
MITSWKVVRQQTARVAIRSAKMPSGLQTFNSFGQPNHHDGYLQQQIKVLACRGSLGVGGYDGEGSTRTVPLLSCPHAIGREPVATQHELSRERANG